MKKPKIIAIVGSSRFKPFHLGVAQQETLKGNIVLLAGFWHHVDSLPITDAKKEELDQLMMAKVALADELVVVNVHGYIGTSTKRAITEAEATNKPIRYLEP